MENKAERGGLPSKFNWLVLGKHELFACCEVASYAVENIFDLFYYCIHLYLLKLYAEHFVNDFLIEFYCFVVFIFLFTCRIY